MRAFKNILVVVKQTPYEQYLQLKAQGRAPVALRWERLKNRYSVHRKCVDEVTRILSETGIQYSVIGREELHRGIIQDKDLLIAVGGDGTVLNTASYLDETIPILGINSDPTRPEMTSATGRRIPSVDDDDLQQEQGVTKLKDERRSKGALCAGSATNVQEFLPRVLFGQVAPHIRSRAQCLVRSTNTETRLPPALNDLLVANPIPAAVSRFRLSLCTGQAAPSFKPCPEYQELFSLNIWSSGIWICTATGSTAVMNAAGGYMMEDKSSDELQYMVREQMIDDHCELSNQKKLGHGKVCSTEMLNIRWNSQFGAIYVDGSHFKHELQLGDEIKIDSHAPVLQMFRYSPPSV